jgi:hypothetical protein
MMIYDVLKTRWWGCCCICFYVWFHCCCYSIVSVSEFGGRRWWRRSIAWIHSLESSERKRCLRIYNKLSTFIYFLFFLFVWHIRSFKLAWYMKFKTNSTSQKIKKDECANKITIFKLLIA